MTESNGVKELVRNSTSITWCRITCPMCTGKFLTELKTIIKPRSFAPSRGGRAVFSPDDGLKILEELKGLAPESEQDRKNWEKPVMLQLYVCWHAIGEVSAREFMASALRDTYAGEVLTRMIVHHERVKAEREAYENTQSPEAVAARRAAKKVEIQRRHATRLELKKQRDAEYWASRGGRQ